MPDIEVVELTSGVVPIPGPKGDKGDKGDTGPQGEQGVQGLTGPIGATGDKGEPGVGLPSGGTPGQVLVNAGDALEWTDFPEVEPGLHAIPLGSLDAFDDLSTQYADRLNFSSDFKLTYSTNVDGEYVGTLTLSEDAGPAIPGADGEDGKSAYELAVEAGFVGTQAAWLASLKGAQGDKGDTGNTGATGPKGDTGSAGPKGDTGGTGPAGPDGQTGATGPKGDTGAAGANGQGVPVGGTTGQVLRKVDGTDFNTQWATPAAGGTLTAFTFTNGAGVTGTVTNGTSTPALALTLGAITPSSVAATGTVTGTNIVRGVGASVPGKPADNEVVMVTEAPYAFTATATNSSAKALTAATASAVFTIKKGTTTVGTFTFAAGATVATKSITSGAIAKGDIVSITAPATADATLKDISFLVIV